MVAAQVLTWTAAPPHDVFGDAATVAGASAGILPITGDRSLPFFGDGDSNGFLPVGIWGASGYSAMVDGGIQFSGGGHDIRKKTPSPSPKEIASARQFLRRAKFSAVARDTPDAAVTVLRQRVETMESALAHNPSTSLAIVMSADWRVVGEFLSDPKHAEQLRLVEAELNKRAEGFRINRDRPTATPKASSKSEKLKQDKSSDATEVKATNALMRKFKDAVRDGKGVNASFNDGEAAATFDLQPSAPSSDQVVRRLTVTDLRLSPTIGFVARLARDLGIRFTPATVFVVDGENITDPALANLLNQP